MSIGSKNCHQFYCLWEIASKHRPTWEIPNPGLFLIHSYVFGCIQILSEISYTKKKLEILLTKEQKKRNKSNLKVAKTVVYWSIITASSIKKSFMSYDGAPLGIDMSCIENRINRSNVSSIISI